MVFLPTYILSVTTAALLCTISQRLTLGKGSSAGIIRIVCGTIMATVILKPIVSLDFPDLSAYWNDLERDITTVVAAGTEYSQQALRSRISEEIVSYIQEKGELLGVSLKVDVELDESTIPVPIRIYLSGNASPSARLTLTDIIEKDIGIRREDQIWK